MAIGDAAAAAGMAIVDGSTTDAKDIDTEINRSRDYIAGVKTTADAAGTVAGAALPKAEVIASGASASPGKVPRYDSGNRFEAGTPQTNFQVANKSYVDSKVGAGGNYLPITGGDITGSLGVANNIYTPGASPATTGYTIAYINSDGRIGKGASSRRWKKRIRRATPADIPDVFGVPLSVFQMRGGDGTWLLGYIAEDLEGTPMERFIVRDAEGRPDSIDIIQLLMVQVAVLNQRLEGASDA